MEETHLSYSAGLFDGEGWFSISKVLSPSHKRGFQFQAHAALVIRQEEVLKDFVILFGGTIRQQKKYKENHNNYYRWRVTGQGALGVARELTPFLKIKKPQALLITEFQESKGSWGPNRLTDEQYDFYQRCYEQMSSLNQRGVPEDLTLLVI